MGHVSREHITEQDQYLTAETPLLGKGNGVTVVLARLGSLAASPEVQRQNSVAVCNHCVNIHRRCWSRQCTKLLSDTDSLTRHVQAMTRIAAREFSVND